MKTERRLAREFAIQALFHREGREAGGGDRTFEDFWSMFQRRHQAGDVTLLAGAEDDEPDGSIPDKPKESVRLFAEKLIRGTLDSLVEVDRLITASADNWRLDRMSLVDRNILRLAVYETRFAEPPVPPAVVIDEAVELAKRFGTVESGRFVNGILDHIFQADLKQPSGKAVADDETP